MLAQDRTDKVSVIKFKRRTTYKRMGTHRQSFTLVEITGITGGPKAKMPPPTSEVTSHGTQESRRQHSQRPRFRVASASA